MDSNYLLAPFENFILQTYKNKIKLLKKLFGGDLVIDALLHLPSGLIEFFYTENLDYSLIKKNITIPLTVLNHLEKTSKKSPFKILAQDQKGNIVNLVFFNLYAKYVNKIAPKGKKILVSGILEKDKDSTFQIIHPEYIGELNQLNNWKGIKALYPLTAGIQQNNVRNVIATLLKKTPELPEWHDNDFVNQNNLISFKKALYLSHNPNSFDALSVNSPSKKRIIIDEFFAYHLSQITSNRKNIKSSGLAKISSNKLSDKLLSFLPFKLTNDQTKAIEEIKNDLKSPKQMLRLVQGDVGSGKTIVALCCALEAIDAGYQVAFLVPTEILARQHFKTISSYLKDFSIHVDLLTSKEKGKKRQQILENILSGNTKILIGTHAILQEWVDFQNLGLVIIDEQQRFGVEQRMLLNQKGNNPDILSMTATPIPRTLQLAQYGEMDVSLIKEKPFGRKSVQTSILCVDKINDLLDRFKNLLDKDQKIYWVCPIIDESEKSDLIATQERFQYLQKYFGDQVALLHGKMPSSEKQLIMEDFSKGSKNILVATTVIEVGVDVPQATVIVIEHAERFGLSQLHQLRGRVGRNDLQSYCILLYHYPISNIAKARLKALQETNDGFLIAEKDLKLRGSGETIGTKQSGIINFRICELNPENYEEFKTLDGLFAKTHKEAINLIKNQNIIDTKISLILELFNYKNASLYKLSG